MSKDLKARVQVRGLDHLLRYMQAAGMINDHVVGCYRAAELQRAGGVARRWRDRIPRSPHD
jgi:3-methyladenine DNA glycosylase Tag